MKVWIGYTWFLDEPIEITGVYWTEEDALKSALGADEFEVEGRFSSEESLLDLLSFISKVDKE